MKPVRGKKPFIAAVALLAALTALPATGWVVRLQLRLIGGETYPAISSLAVNPVYARDARDIACANRHPDDYARQLALAVQAGNNTEAAGADGLKSPIVRALVALRPRFDSRPGLQAHILRFLCCGDVKINRPFDELAIESAEYQTKNRADAAKSQAERSRPEAIALAEETAARGETLDPNNGFFPVMRAVAFFADQKDAQAIDEIHRAALAPNWNDYTSEEPSARFQLLHDAQGETGAISRQCLAASVLLPHYARIRELARLATSIAIRQEVERDFQGGFAIRRSVARIGALMRAKSTFTIGSLVGIAVVKISAMRVGDSSSNVYRDDDPNKAEREAVYVAHLSYIGHPEEARWYVAEQQAGQSARSIFNQYERETNGGLAPALTLIVWWGIGLLTLLSALWTLTLGGFAAIMARRATIREGKSLRYPVRLTGLAAASLVMIWTAFLAATFHDLVFVDSQTVAGFTAGTVLILLLLAIPVWRLRRDGSRRYVVGEIAKGVAALIATAALLAALLGLASLTCVGVCRTFRAIVTVSCGNFDTVNSDMDFETQCEFQLIAAAFVLLIPVIAIAGTAMIRSRIRRVPVLVGVTRGMRAAALPVAAILFALYGVALVGTAIEENAMNNRLAATVKNECRYAADTTGQTWPDLVTLDREAPKP